MDRHSMENDRQGGFYGRRSTVVLRLFAQAAPCRPAMAILRNDRFTHHASAAVYSPCAAIASPTCSATSAWVRESRTPREHHQIAIGVQLRTDHAPISHAVGIRQVGMGAKENTPPMTTWPHDHPPTHPPTQPSRRAEMGGTTKETVAQGMVEIIIQSPSESVLLRRPGSPWCQCRAGLQRPTRTRTGPCRSAPGRSHGHGHDHIHSTFTARSPHVHSTVAEAVSSQYAARSQYAVTVTQYGQSHTATATVRSHSHTVRSKSHSHTVTQYGQSHTVTQSHSHTATQPPPRYLAVVDHPNLDL